MAEVLLGQDGLLGTDGAEGGEELPLGADVLDDRLDHELAPGEPAELAHERQPPERAAPLVLAAPALLHAAREPASMRPRALERRVVDVAADHLEAALEQHLRDARPHLPEADDTHARDRCFHARER